MSLKVDKDNIFFLLPESRYSVSNRIDGYMEKNFTLHIDVKVDKKDLTENQVFAIARNGMHSGISFFKDQTDKVVVIFSYWFTEKNGNNIVKDILYTLQDDISNDFNKYTIIGDDTKRKMDFYINSNLIGSISYTDVKKVSYENAFYWFGCGSMICEEQHRSIGTFEYKNTFLLNTNISIEEVDDILDNYETKYSHAVFNGLRKINDNYKYKENFAFFCDFKEYNRYKVWDLSFNGNYPQFYIEKNIYF